MFVVCTYVCTSGIKLISIIQKWLLDTCTLNHQIIHRDFNNNNNTIFVSFSLDSASKFTMIKVNLYIICSYYNKCSRHFRQNGSTDLNVFQKFQFLFKKKSINVKAIRNIKLRYENFQQLVSRQNAMHY